VKKLTIILLLGIVVLGIILRLYRFDSPIADWHSWRQADTSAVSRNFVNEGFDLLHPKFDDLSNVPSGINNPEGYRFVEFPLFYELIGIFTLEGWGRLVSIFSSVAATIFIFLILKKHQNDVVGLIGAFFFAVLPYSIYFGRTILPDMTTSAAILGGIYFFDSWLSKKNFQFSIFNFQFWLAVLLTMTALLLKPFAIFFTFPMIYLAFDKFGISAVKKWQLWLFAFLTLAPLIGWRLWMLQFPEGIPANQWLLNGGNIRFRPSYFWWIYAERIGKLILGYWGVSLFVLGLISKVKKDGLFIYSFLLSTLAYLVVVARGNVQHDYYQILILPTICLFLGLGGDFLLNFVKTYTNKYVGPIVFTVITLFTLMFGWYFVRDYFNINNRSIVTAGKAADLFLPKEAKVIAINGGDTSFLYQTKRKGWASFQNDIEEMINLGAEFLIFASPTPSDLTFSERYQIVDQKSQYVIYDLKKPL